MVAKDEAYEAQALLLVGKAVPPDVAEKVASGLADTALPELAQIWASA